MTPTTDAATDIERQAEELAAKLAELTERRDAAVKRARELMAAEDSKAGVYYAQEIFAAKQEKLALETEMEITRRQRVRLLMR
ncbi:MAG: hypothetical protein AB7U59_03245 [Desulfovibrionaceae bacterium]